MGKNSGRLRQSLEEILASCSDTLFPAGMGDAPVAVDSVDADGDTPLHLMAWRGNNHGLALLISAGADVNAVGDMSETPLHIAVRNQNLAAIEALLAAGADPSPVSEFGESPKSRAKAIGGAIGRLFNRR
jgi:ankyrin repeat protein